MEDVERREGRKGGRWEDGRRGVVVLVMSWFRGSGVAGGA